MEPNIPDHSNSTNPDFPTTLPEKIPSKKRPIIVVLAILFFGIIMTFATAVYWFVLKDKVKPVACTMEAKICPDGSSVGRVGPNCEFAPCPTSEARALQNETITYYDLNFKLPIGWTTDTSGRDAGPYVHSIYDGNGTYMLLLQIFQNYKSDEKESYLQNLVSGTIGEISFVRGQSRRVENGILKVITHTLISKDNDTYELTTVDGTTEDADTILRTFEFRDTKTLSIPELGIQITLPDKLSDLRYHIEKYDNSTAALFTTDQLASKFPNCEFPTGGLGWITRVSESTTIHNKKVGDYYYGIEIMKNNCSRKSGSEEGDLLESSQKKSFLQIFDTIDEL